MANIEGGGSGGGRKGGTTGKSTMPDYVIDEYGNIWPRGEPPVDSKGAPDYGPTGGSSGSSGGRGYSGGSGGGSTDSRVVNNWFLDWFGSEPAAMIQQAKNEGWTEADVRRAAVKAGANGPAMEQARNMIRTTIFDVFGDPDALPSSLVDALITDGVLDQGYLQTQYLPMLKNTGLDVTKSPILTDYINAWVDMTGRPITWTATEYLNNLVRTGGISTSTMNNWTEWIKGTDSAITGNWGAAHRAGITSDFASILGRDPTAAELDPSGPYWNLNEAARLESIRGTDEYKTIYAGKPTYMSEGEYIAYARALSWVYTGYYGPTTDVTDLPFGGKSATPVAPSTPAQTATPTPQWKSLNMSQFDVELAAVGITRQGDKYYLQDGTEVAWADLIDYLPKGEFYQDEQGYHYMQDYGAIDPRTGEPATTTRPRPSPLPDGVSVTTDMPYADLSRFGIFNLSPEEVAAAAASGYTPEQIGQMFQWHEEAIFYEGAYDPVLGETLGLDFSHEEWESFARGGEGSGSMRLAIMEAQNLYAFKEYYIDKIGREPTQADYAFLKDNYVSPAQFVRHIEAGESADAMYDEVNELLQRVYGQSVTKQDLVDMALGRPNSGELRALITQAEQLDQYRWLHKQYYDSEPTPNDYARYAGYASPAELQWEIVTTEKVAELGDSINEAFQKAYGYTLGEDELWTMLGEQEGSGELRKLWKKAEEETKEREYSIIQAHLAEKASPVYTRAETGGMKEALPGLESLSMN